MFNIRGNKKGSDGVRKSIQKLLDPKRDPDKRLANLRHIIENATQVADHQTIFYQFDTHFFYVFYENFLITEQKLRGQTGRRGQEELEQIIWVLEEMIFLMPDKINQRWQYNSILDVVKRLIHPDNCLHTRIRGTEIFLQWFQALQDNAGEHARMIYASLIPGMPSPKGSDGRSHTLSSLINENVGGIITPVPIQPIVPPEVKESQDQNWYLIKIFTQTVIGTMATYSAAFKWKDKNLERRGFEFMWDMFKEYYMLNIFTDLDLSTDIYNTSLQLHLTIPQQHDYVKYIDDTGSVDSAISAKDDLLPARVAFIQWLVQYCIDVPENESTPRKRTKGQMETLDETDELNNESVSSATDDKESVSSSFESEEEHRKHGKIIRGTVFSTRENVNLVHEIFRQAFLLPFVKVDDCIYDKENAISPAGVVIKAFSMWLNASEGRSPPCVKPVWCEEPRYDGSPEDVVRAGDQAALQSFIVNSSYVFLLSPKPDMMEMHSCTCKDVINQYRSIIMHLEMNDDTWNQLLIILVHITRAHLNAESPNGNLSSSVTQPLIQTLIVAWIKASLYAAVSSELWNDMLMLSKEMTHLSVLITEWAKTMEVVSNMLIQHVYNLDIDSLPLDRSGARRRGKRRPAEPTKESQPSQPSQQTALASPISAQDGASIRDPKFFTRAPDQSSETDNSRIKRAHSDAEIFTGESGSSVRYRTRSGGSFKGTKAESDTFSRFNNTDGVESETASLTQDWNPAINHQDHVSESYDEAPPMLFNKTASSFARSESDVGFGPYDTNSVIIRNDGNADLPDEYTEIDEDTTVMAGGRKTGWSADVAYVLWKRILGVLGDVNKIENPEIHARVFGYLHKQWEILYKVRNNLSVSATNTETPEPPELVPPLYLFVPWCLGAFQLDSRYQDGQSLALELICRQFIVNIYNDYELDNHMVCQFYRLLRWSLGQTDNLEFTYKAVKSCGGGFFSRNLPGSQVLIPHFLDACEKIAKSSDLDDGCPRVEAQQLVQSLIFVTKDDTECQRRIGEFIIYSCQFDPSGQSRCVAFQSLSLWLVSRLTMPDPSLPEIAKALSICLMSIKRSDDINVAAAAASCLRTLVKYNKELLALSSSLLCTILTALPLITSDLMLKYSTRLRENRLFTVLLFLISEWTLSIEPAALLEPLNMELVEETCIFEVIVKTLKIATGDRSSSFEFDLSALQTDLFDPNTIIAPINEWTAENSTDEPRGNQKFKQAAQCCLDRINIHLNHFPLKFGPTLMSSTLIDNDGTDLDDTQLLESKNVQFISIDERCIVTLIEFEDKVRVITRTHAGKHSWSCRILDSIEKSETVKSQENVIETAPESLASDSDYISDSIDRTQSDFDQHENQEHAMADFWQHGDHDHEDENALNIETSLPTSDSPLQIGCKDRLEQMLRYINSKSQECFVDVPLTVPSKAPFGKDYELRIIDTIKEQFVVELDPRPRLRLTEPFFNAKPKASTTSIIDNTFWRSRFLLSQLGFLTWEKRQKVDLLDKVERLKRELKNLDNRGPIRENHKFACIYVGNGQEDKQSILSNQAGSRAFENFVRSLGWEIELSSHRGYMGGLQNNGSNGLSSIYYADSSLELMYHVSTMFNHEEPAHIKVRHIGNDNVQVIWSEHWREYRTSIISSEFADVVICIYPLAKNNLFRIRIIQKENLPFFGPLTDNITVSGDVLGVLVRETAINAARALRSKIDGYRHFFEDRNSYLVETIRKLRLPTNNSFEKYCTELLHPSCKAEPSESVSPPEQLRRIVSDTQSESGSVANSLQSSSIFSVSYKKSEHRPRTESVISDGDLTPKIGAHSRFFVPSASGALPSTPSHELGNF